MLSVQSVQPKNFRLPKFDFLDEQTKTHNPHQSSFGDVFDVLKLFRRSDVKNSGEIISFAGKLLTRFYR